MKIIRDNNWKTPIGFYKYSEEGRDIKLNKIKKEEKYLELKRRECSREKEFSICNIIQQSRVVVGNSSQVSTSSIVNNLTINDSQGINKLQVINNIYLK